MNFRYSFLLATTLSLLSSSPSFSMENDDRPAKTPIILQQFDCVEFVKSFVPKDSTQDYIQKVANCYRDALVFKEEIKHDGRVWNDFLPVGSKSQINLDEVIKDYGWSFPPIPRVQKHLLEFCAQSKTPVNMMDIGAGYGVDSLFSLLTKNVQNLFALENQKAQRDVLQQTVEQSIRQTVDPNFSLKPFKALKKDFLTLAEDYSPGAFDVLNPNKVIHFFDPAQTKIFGERAKSLLKKGGRLFLTCLTPSPKSEIEKFMNSQVEKGIEFPGYVFYSQKVEILKNNHPGAVSMLAVRSPKENEKPAHFFQTIHTKKPLSLRTDRVMHYHTAQTLEKILGDGFRILETMITTPEENYGTDHMISIVAEKI